MEQYTFEVEMLESPKYYLALTAIFRDDAKYLEEWIEFYKLIGVEHFYLYNHNSNDHYMQVLEPYIKDQTIDLINLNLNTETPQEWLQLQCNAYLHITLKVKNEVEWLIIVDSDEFLFPVKEQNLPQVLSKYDEYAALSINWRIFGSGNVTNLQKDDLLTEKLFLREEYSYDPVVKSIVKPRYVETFINPHLPILKSGYAQITEDYKLIYGPYSYFRGDQILSINHYWARDWEYFTKNKLNRVYLVNKLLPEEQKKQRINQLINDNKKYSTTYDDKILKYLPALKERITKKTTINTKNLLQAVIDGNDEKVKKYLNLRIDIDYFEPSIGATSLYIAAENNYFNIIELLLEYGANTEIKANNGATPLYIAVQNNNLDIVKSLLKHGANISAECILKYSPLRFAQLLGYSSLVEIMEGYEKTT